MLCEPNSSLGTMRRRELICVAICLALILKRAWFDVGSSSLQKYFDFSSSADTRIAIAGEDDASFTTLFRPDDHVISVPSIPVDCSRLLVVMTELNAGWGMGNMLNMYRHALMIAAYNNRTLVLYEPESNTSAFGCPASGNDTSPTSYPSGLQRLVHHPEWISGNCPVPCSMPYDFWMQRANMTEPGDPIICSDQGKDVSVLPIGGIPLKVVFIQRVYWDMHFRKQKEWIARLGADSSEMAWFSANEWEEGAHWDTYREGEGIQLVSLLNKKVNITSWDAVFGLLTRAGIVRFQPWIARDLRQRISEISIAGDYVGIHVRRGDKLKLLDGISTSATLVDAFWQNQGYNRSTQPTNYIPLSHYLTKLDASSPSDIYVATDDPETVKREIRSLKPHRFRFHLNPESASSTGHLQDASDCSRKYDKTISALVDLAMVIRSTIAVAEYSSNWGILVRSHRTFFADGRAGSASVRDMRIAFGVSSPVCEFVDCVPPREISLASAIIPGPT